MKTKSLTGIPTLSAYAINNLENCIVGITEKVTRLPSWLRKLSLILASVGSVVTTGGGVIVGEGIIDTTGTLGTTVASTAVVGIANTGVVLELELELELLLVPVIWSYVD